MRRKIREEVSTDFWLDPSGPTALIRDGEMEGPLDGLGGTGRPVPYMINLLPPQIQRSEQPDHVAIITFRGRVRGQARVADLFGLLRVERSALLAFFDREEWAVEEALALPGVRFDLTEDLPSDALLRPTLTGRAFQALLRHRQVSPPSSLRD